MKYEISTISQLKAAVFDAIEKRVVLSPDCLRSFETFDNAVDDYICMFRHDEAIRPTLYPVEDTVLDWYEELTGSRPTPVWRTRINVGAFEGVSDPAVAAELARRELIRTVA